MKDDWSLAKLPPKGHKDVPEFAWNLFEQARDERDRLQLPEIWKANYKLYRGDHWGRKKGKNTLTLNLFFANVQRTVANVTARDPVAECVDLDGIDDGTDKVITARLRKWWKETNQGPKLRTTTQKNEKYGITIEKPYWDAANQRPGIVIVDPFAFFPCPGHWEDISTDCPYVAHAYPEPVSGVESMFGVKDVEPSDVYSVLGEDRENDRPITAGTVPGTMNHSSNNSTSVVHYRGADSDYKEERALVVEVWVRDNSKNKEGRFNFPGGVRCITVTNEGKLLLADEPNPNINFELPPEHYEKSYLYKRLPFYTANSYEDTTSIWGFSAADQVAELNVMINQIVSRLTNYVMKASAGGILVIPPKSGLTRAMINNDPGLVLFPQTDEAAAGIRYVPQPNLPSTFFNAFDLLLQMYDRVYAIQDADRGNTPKNIVAASAIVALQERNAVLIQHKINAVDYLVEQRGHCAISLWQNHGHIDETIQVNEEIATFKGTDLAGREFSYIVEAGSSTPKTQLQLQEQAIGLYDKGVIDREAVLEQLNFPKWKEIIERVGEGQLGQAMQILIQAGLPEDQAAMLQQYLMQPQQDSQEGAMGTAEPQPGTPVAYQGAMPQ